MEAVQARDVADRDQLWACLRLLREEVELLAGETEPLESRQQKLAILLARIVLAELDYRVHAGIDE